MEQQLKFLRFLNAGIMDPADPNREVMEYPLNSADVPAVDDEITHKGDPTVKWCVTKISRNYHTSSVEVHCSLVV